jgi:hypothetical protein
MADICETCGGWGGIHGSHDAPTPAAKKGKVVRATRSTANEPISRLEEFKTNGALSARGHTGPGDELMFGRLSDGARAKIKALSDINYVVSSYGTPIGVHSSSEGWVIPKQKFSVTTSTHQGALRRGAAASGRPITEV